MNMRWFILGGLISLSTQAASIKESAFLSRVEQNFPQIKSQEIKIQVLEAKLQKARGSFDSFLTGSHDKFTQGYYDGASFETSFVKPLKFANSRIEFGHRSARGELPIYYAEHETHSGGENFIRFKASFLRYRSIDPRRFELFVSRNNLAIEQFEYALKVMDIRAKANQYFWKWVVISEKEKLYENLVQLNQKRFSAIKKRVKKKDLAEIFLTESEQYLLNFQGKLAEIQAQKKIIKNIIHFYDPLISQSDEPQYALPTILADPINELDLEQVVKTRPEMQMLSLLIENNKFDLMGAKQKLIPKLDVKVSYVDSPLGFEQRFGSEGQVGLSLEIPLERNLGRGEVARARNELKLLAIQRDLIKGEIEFTVQNLYRNLQGLSKSINFIAREVKNSRTLQNAEWSKFKAGASDFFLLNTRDMNFAKAQIKLVEKYAEFKILLFQQGQWRQPVVFSPKI